MQPVSPPPAAAPTIAPPKLSALALYGIAGIAVVAIAAIFGYILFVSGLSFTSQLWWMGIAGLVFAFLFYVVYAATHNRSVAFPLSGAFFVIAAGSFYGSIFVDAAQSSLGKLVLSLILSIFVVIVLLAMFYMFRGEERDAIRKSQRKVTP